MSRPTILVVDDDKMIHRLIQQLFGDTYDLVCVTGPSEAMMELMHLTPGAILLDQHLDMALGTELLEGIRTHKVLEHVKDTPVIMLTSDRSADVYEESLWLGTVAYVTKPVDYDTLAEAIASALAGG